jgi:hypothetical protein
MPKKKQGFERGLGHYSAARNSEVRRSDAYDRSGNPRVKPRELDKQKLEEAASTRKALPRNAR